MVAAEELLYSAHQWGQVNLRIEQSSAAQTLESILADPDSNFEPLEPYPPNGRLRQLSRPVGRLDIRFDSGKWVTCTASLIGPDRLLTNHHCVPGTGDYGRVTETRLLMGYYSETDDTGIEWFQVHIKPIEANGRMDYSVLKVEGRPGDTWGTVSMVDKEPSAGEGLLIVHHPAGQRKHITRGGCRAGKPVPSKDAVLLHKCDTLGGSSGAPIFSDDAGGMLALHYAGAPAPGPGSFNYGVLVKWLKERSTSVETTLTISNYQKPSIESQPAPQRHVSVLVPEMVRIPGGTFRMGDLQGVGDEIERPVRTVRIRSFAIGKYEVTFEEYDAFALATNHRLPKDGGFGRGRRPVINLSWDEAVAYADWLSKQTGKRYRLPTEAEWEYAARSGAETAYWWGNEANLKYANYGRNWPVTQRKWELTAPVGSYKPNTFGLYDMAGNVGEWVQDCSHGNYKFAPSDGSAWEEGECKLRRVRGGSFESHPLDIRSAKRDLDVKGVRDYDIGFRLAQDI